MSVQCTELLSSDANVDEEKERSNGSSPLFESIVSTCEIRTSTPLTGKIIKPYTDHSTSASPLSFSCSIDDTHAESNIKNLQEHSSSAEYGTHEAEKEEKEQINENENGEEEVYCLCRGPHAGRFMIQCDACEEW